MARNKAPVIADADKLECAKKFKSEGNECHKHKNFKQSIGKYHRALLQLKAIGQSKSSGLGALLSESDLEQMGHSSKVSPEMQRDVSKLMADCYNNLAACLLQGETPNYEKIVQYCDSVLELSPENVKGHYRKGLALYHLRNFEKALECFRQAVHVAKGSSDQAFTSLLERQMKLCRERLKEQDQQLKATYQSMFNQPPGR